MTLAWEPAPDASRYHIYYAHEPIDDPDNYAAYDGGTWIADVTSPHTASISDPAPVYHFIVTAVTPRGETEPSNTAAAILRYRVTGPTVIDLTTGLEWMRCSNGQTWNPETDECDGELARLDWAQIHESMPAGWGLPTVEQFASIRYCDTSQYFPEPEQFSPPSAFTECDEDGEYGYFPDAFPPSSFGHESIYMTSTVRRGDLTAYTFRFGPRGALVPFLVSTRSTDVRIYSRFVRPAS